MFMYLSSGHLNLKGKKKVKALTESRCSFSEVIIQIIFWGVRISLSDDMFGKG